MSTNSKQFAADLAKFEAYAIKRCDDVLHESIIGLTKEVVLLTPHITGTARSNYFWSSATPGTASSVSVSVDGAPSLERAITFGASAKAGGKVHLYTSLSYIGDLEYGAPGHAPYAMMRTAAARWKQIGADAEKRASK